MIFAFSVSVLLFFIVVVQGTKVIMREYNYINYKEMQTLEEFLIEFTNPQTATITKYVYLGLATEACSERIHHPSFLAGQRFAGGFLITPVILPRSQFPFTKTKECAEILFYKPGDALEAPSGITTSFGDSELTSWLSSQLRIPRFEIINEFPFPVEVYYHVEGSGPMFQFRIDSNKTHIIQTFLGHVFSVVAAPGTEYNYPIPIDYTTRPEYNKPGYVDIVDYLVSQDMKYVLTPYNHLEICETVVNDLTIVPATTDTGMTPLVSEAMTSPNPFRCDDMLTKFLSYSNAIWHAKRLALNYLQPISIRPYSTIGFEKRALPKETFTWLKDWYDQEKQHTETPEHTVGPCMNQAVAPSQVTHITPELKERLRAEIQPILEGWYGGSLKLTSIYGIRRYNNGSVLRMHVDTARTHAVSCIINVDQEVEKDWPLLILDHDYAEHNVIMKPGDMVLYESAKALHGRVEPMVGNHYDNIFVHFQPLTDWDYDWFV